MASNNIKVSVIVPIYNVEKYLNKCIETILNQNYKNIEIILVNDGSTDGSKKICNDYAQKDNRIKIINKENEGVSIARNTGIQEATGDYICFVDGDDYIMEDYVDYLLNLALSNNTKVAVTTEMFGNFQPNQVEKEQVKICTGEQTVEKILCYRIPIGVYCKIFKRSFLQKEEIKFIPKLFMGEGFNFNVECFQKVEKVAIGNRRIYYYRRDNGTSATTKFSINKCDNSLYALEVMKSKINFNNEEIRKAWNYAKWRTYTDVFDYIYLGNAKSLNEDKYKIYRKYIKKNAITALKVPISTKDKIRACIMKIYPEIIPIILKIRRKKYKIHVEASNEKNRSYSNL